MHQQHAKALMVVFGGETDIGVDGAWIHRSGDCKAPVASKHTVACGSRKATSRVLGLM
ncbi:MAG: hypothetical protein QUV05_11935 [Phycisphaerae bacterium]|nr:hypothetical protein [Phycisphaerae bacterium]